MATLRLTFSLRSSIHLSQFKWIHLLALAGRDRCAEMEQVLSPHGNEFRTSSRQRAEVHDPVKAASRRQKSDRSQ